MMIVTPKGIMYLIRKDEIKVYCYDDQTGRDEVFLISEVSDYKPKPIIYYHK